jgi:hypothetical protein
VAAFFGDASFPWWIAGGWALEAAGGRRRRHEDLDVAVLRRDVEAVRERFADFHLWEAHSGTLRPLGPGDELSGHVEQLWVRRDADNPWIADLLLTPTDGETWLYKRDHRVRLPLAEVGFKRDGIRYLRPGIALLYKARLARPKDDEDFVALRPSLPAGDARFLDDALATVNPEHPWRRGLRA